MGLYEEKLLRYIASVVITIYAVMIVGIVPLNDYAKWTPLSTLFVNTSTGTLTAGITYLGAGSGTEIVRNKGKLQKCFDV